MSKTLVDLETKFHEILAQSPKPFTMYLQSNKGFVKIMYQNKWEDGLSNVSLLRLLNTKLGISIAPATWEHLLELLQEGGIDLAEFERTVDRRINSLIIKDHRSLLRSRELFGDEYVDNVLESSSSGSFAEGLLDTLAQFLKKSKDKPKLNLIKGGIDI